MLIHRLISGAGLVGFVVVVVFWRSPLAVALFVVAAIELLCLATKEFFALARRREVEGYPEMTMGFGAALFVAVTLASVFSRSPGISLGAIDALVFGSFLAVGVIRVGRAPEFSRELPKLALSIAAYAYLCWPLSFLVRTYFMPGGHHAFLSGRESLFLFVVLVTKCGDIGGYAVGRLTAMRAGGNHKLVPHISPGKSWEGLVGGLVLSVVAALALNKYVQFDLALPGVGAAGFAATAVILGVLLALVGLLGDLSESIIKRWSGAKDAGSALPGMGGVLDMVDSLILAAPLFYGLVLVCGA